MTLKVDCTEMDARAYTSNLLATKNFRITGTYAENSPALLSVMQLQFVHEDKIGFEISRGEETSVGKIVIVSAAYEDSFKPSVNVWVNGAKALKDGSFVVERGAKVGISLEKANEITENCVVTHEVSLKNERLEFATGVGLFIYVLKSLQEGIIMDSPEGMPISTAQFTKFAEQVEAQSRGFVMLRFVHKMVQILEGKEYFLKGVVKDGTEISAPQETLRGKSETGSMPA